MSGLGFLAPWFLLGALAAAVPLVLHLFRRETAPLRDFSAVRFVSPTVVEQTRQRRLSDLLLLVLRIAALLVLAFAFARPFLRGAGRTVVEPVTVVAVDTSDSMSAPETWRDAQRLARAAIDASPAGPVALVSFGDEAQIVMEPVRDRRAVRAAAERLHAGGRGTSYEAAFHAIEPLFAGSPGRLVLVSDLQRHGLEGGGPLATPTGVVTIVRRAAPMQGNVFVSALERSTDGLLAVVENEGIRTWKGTLTVRMGGRPLGAGVPLSIAPGVATELRLPGPLPPDGVVEASVDDAEGAQGDNARRLILDPLPQMAIAVVTVADAAREVSLYVAGALEAATRSDGSPALGLDPRSTTASELGDAGWWRRHRAAVLLATRGLDHRAREALRAAVREGLGLFVVAGPDVEAVVVRDLLDGAVTLRDAGQGVWPASLAVSDPRHPLLTALGPFASRLNQVEVDRGVRMDGRATHAVMRFTNGLPALMEYRADRGRVLVFASDLGRRWGTFPLHPTFAPFMFEAVRYLAGPEDDRREATPADLPRDAVPTSGVVSIGQPPRRVAVNVDRREARLEFATAEELLAAVVQVAATADAESDGATRESQQRLWRWALVALFVLLVLEGIAARRGGTARPRPETQPSSGPAAVRM